VRCVEVEIVAIGQHHEDFATPAPGRSAVTAYQPHRRFLVNGHYEYHNTFKLVNSWGTTYGNQGVAYLIDTDMDKLVVTNGETSVR
jgi:hypothetical protein